MTRGRHRRVECGRRHKWTRWGAPTRSPFLVLTQSRSCESCGLVDARQVVTR